jgi:hypothetical protein
VALWLRVKTLLRHARPWISKTEKGETIYGIEFELDWPETHLPASSKISEAANPAASPSTKKKQNHE